VLDGWGDPFDIVAPGACYKQYPSCASTHPAVDAALTLVRDHGPFDARAIARVDSWTSAPRLAHTNRPDPGSALEAKFSVQYCVARALLNGRLAFEHFDGEAYRDPAVRALLPRVFAAPCTDQQFAPGNRLGAEVKVTLADGSSYSAKLDRPAGRTSANPIAHEDIAAKFEDCAGRVLTADAVAAVQRRIDTFESLESVRDFTGLLEPAEPGVGPLIPCPFSEVRRDRRER
jgi:2-methylcitrate dehydratase PrpD